MGDIRLSLNYFPPQISSSSHQLIYGLSVLLPTGDADKLTGNGATEIGLSATGILKKLGESGQYDVFGGLSLIWMEQGDVISARQEDYRLALLGGLNWNFTDTIKFIMQLEHQTAQYQSTLDELGKGSTQLLLGTQFKTEDNSSFTLAFGENLLTDSSADFSLLFSFLLK